MKRTLTHLGVLGAGRLGQRPGEVSGTVEPPARRLRRSRDPRTPAAGRAGAGRHDEGRDDARASAKLKSAKTLRVEPQGAR